jgi:hypothetical protein
MLGKLITLPLWLIQKCFGVVFGLIRLVFALVGGIIRFIFSRTLGAIFGGLIGFFLGKNHVGIRLWKRKK